MNQPFGIYVGGLGVSLFLIISGAALTWTYKRPVDLRRFYWKRFKGIYPAFWTAWVLAVLYYFIRSGGYPPIQAPLRNIVFTIVGMDGLVANFGVSTAYLLGEWFLGFILIFYLVFPVLLWAVDRYPVPTAIILLVVYGISLYVLSSRPWIPSAVLLPVRLPELAFGMYFVKYVKRVPAWTVVPAASVLVVSASAPDRIPEDLATTFVGAACFLILVVVGRMVANQPVRVLVSLVAKYSYPIFLVHHVVIMELYASMNTMPFLPIQRWVMFAAACAITFGLAVALDHLVKKVVAYTGRSFSGAWWRPEVSPLER